MGCAEGVVFALRSLCETGKSASLPQGPDAVAAAGEDLVRIGLMPDVPDEAVVRRVEHVVQRHRKLDDAKPRAEVAAGHRYRADRLGPKLVHDLLKLRDRQLPQIFRAADRVEKGRRYGQKILVLLRSCRAALMLSGSRKGIRFPRNKVK